LTALREMEMIKYGRRDGFMNTEKLSWVKDLVKAEQQMEESGIVDINAGFDPDQTLISESIQFLNQIKIEMIDATGAFNEMKASTLGRVKIYGIAKTHADFMLFRNGYKMIFSLKKPGQISIRFNFISNNYIPQTQASAPVAATSLMEEDLIESKWGVFGEIVWTHKSTEVKIPNLVRHYLSRFIRESAK
jgi:hypothetical protein